MRGVTYIGGHGGGVDVALGDGRVVSVLPGESVQVSDALAKSLLEQESNWQVEKRPAVKKGGVAR